MNYAVDRKPILDGVMLGIGNIVATFCAERSVGCDLSIPPYPFDPARARALLNEAGYPNGFEMTICTPSGGYPGDRDITLAIVDQLERVGVRARPVVAEYGVFIRQVIDKKLPCDAGFINTSDDLGFAGVHPLKLFHSTRGIVSLWDPANKEFERLVETAEVTLDENAMKDLYRRAQLLFKEEAPGIPLWTTPNVNGVNRNLEWNPRPDLQIDLFDASWK